MSLVRSWGDLKVIMGISPGCGHKKAHRARLLGGRCEMVYGSGLTRRFMEAPEGGPPGNPQLFEGYFQIWPGGKRGRNPGAKYPASGPEWPRLGSARPGLGKVMPGPLEDAGCRSGSRGRGWSVDRNGVRVRLGHPPCQRSMKSCIMRKSKGQPWLLDSN